MWDLTIHPPLGSTSSLALIPFFNRCGTPQSTPFRAEHPCWLTASYLPLLELSLLASTSLALTNIWKLELLLKALPVKAHPPTEDLHSRRPHLLGRRVQFAGVSSACLCDCDTRHFHFRSSTASLPLPHARATPPLFLPDAVSAAAAAALSSAPVLPCDKIAAVPSLSSSKRSY
ncbi:hypothetical protein SDJN02_20338, partial [Cucurbita argyrosperma subsp. argyrosperma]